MCFNEAAAYHCGKPDAETRTRARHAQASMRPQHITAENGILPLVHRGGGPASMRPQHITAENRIETASPGEYLSASMRPQHITAENSTGIGAASCAATPLQ